MITVRPPESLYQAKVPIEGGMCHGRWHFSFDTYRDPDWTRFGNLRVFNDDILTPGAAWPLHPHQEIEVVTYCADGEFRHADEGGRGGVLQKGWVQHTTVGRGMWHSEINNRKDAPMRFIQMWFLPSVNGLEPSVEQKAISREERTNRLLPLVSAEAKEALFLFSDASVFSCALERDREVMHALETRRGTYLLVVEGGPVQVNDRAVQEFGAVKVADEAGLRVHAVADAEILLVDTLLL